MTPEVDEAPAGVIPELTEVSVRAQRIVWALGRGAEPKVVVESLGQLIGFSGLNISHWRGLPKVDTRDFTELPGPHHFHHAPVIAGGVVNVVSHLGDAAVVQRRVRHSAAFRHAIA